MRAALVEAVGAPPVRECTPARTRHNIECIVRLGTYSREMLQQLRRDIGIDYDQRTQGILHFYTSAAELAAAEGPAAQMRALGLRPALDHGGRSPGDRAGAAPHRTEARGRHVHGARRIGRRQPLRARARRALPGRRRAVPHEPHDHGSACRGGQARPRRSDRRRRPLPIPAGRRLRARAWGAGARSTCGRSEFGCRSIRPKATR